MILSITVTHCNCLLFIPLRSNFLTSSRICNCHVDIVIPFEASLSLILFLILMIVKILNANRLYERARLATVAPHSHFSCFCSTIIFILLPSCDFLFSNIFATIIKLCKKSNISEYKFRKMYDYK